MQNVLITGGKSGIGFKTGIYLEKNGYNVVLSVHTEEELNNLKLKIKQMNSRITCIKLDITNEQDRKKIQNLDIDILINNASTCVGGSLIDINTKLVKENFNTNVIGTLRLSQIFIADLFIKRKEGKIVFISSLAGIFPISYIGSYAITKTSINMIAKILKKELKNINMNTKIKLIEPGIYNTGFNDYMFSFINDENILKKKKIFKLIGKNKLTSVINTIYKSITSNNNKLIYRTNHFESILVKLYNLLFS